MNLFPKPDPYGDWLRAKKILEVRKVLDDAPVPMEKRELRGKGGELIIGDEYDESA